MNILKTSLILLMVSISSLLFSQNPSVQDSRGFLNNGLSFVNSENYEKALSQYTKIHRNDTNYEEALYQLADCYRLMGKYDKAAEYCLKGIALNKIYVPDFYIKLSEVRNETKEFDLLISELDSAIAQYPFNYTLKVEKARAMVRNGNQEEGLDALYRILRENPVHPMAHLALGDICYDRELYSQAIVCYAMYLTLNEDGHGTLSRLITFDDKLNQKFKGGEDYPGAEKFLEQGFEEIDILVSNKTAINQKYKTGSRLSFPIIKQTHLVLSKLDDVDGKGFWHEFYIPFMKEHIFDAGIFEGFSYKMAYSAREISSDVEKALRKKASAVSQYENIVKPKIYEFAQITPKNREGKDLEGEFLYSNGVLVGIGTLDKIYGPTGPWIWFHANGQEASMGEYNSKGNRDGEWYFYYKNGVLKAVVNYKDGKFNGAYKDFYDNGLPESDGFYKNGNVNGEFINFYRLGGKMNVRNYDDGIIDGKATYYHRNGKLQYEVTFNEGELDGEFKSYYDDGSLKEVSHYDNGTLDGKITKYHRNGQVKSAYEYVDGKQNGKLIAYFEDGTLHEEGEFKDDHLVGESKAYFPNGKLRVKNTFDENGKKNGIAEVYDRDGNKIKQYEYRKGDLVGYKFYDLDGKVIGSGSNSGKSIEFVEYDQYGNKRSEGIYESGEEDGVWKYYAPGNCMTKKLTYKSGDMHGVQYEYYRNGELSEKYDVEDGWGTGDYNSYYLNKVKYIYGYRYEGDRQGEWEYRHPDNTVYQKTYYRDGYLEGWSEYYSVSGKLTSESYFENGSKIKAVYYDTAGNVNQRVELDNGSGKYIVKYPNGQMMLEGNYTNGIPNGSFTWYYPDGSIETKGAFFNDERHGEWTWYYRNGQMETQRFYVYGTPDSVRTDWFEDGKVSYRAQFKNGELEGIATGYFPGSGNKRYEINYVDGARRGETIYYGENGEAVHKRFYVDGWLTQYAVQGKDGKMGPFKDISTDGSTDHVVAYYKNGNVAMDINFNYGYLHGEYTHNYSNGKPYLKETFDMDNEEGESKMYLANGTLIHHQQYQFGMLHGNCLYYNSNGKLKREVMYVMDEMEGVVKIYDKNGKLTGTAYYFDNDYYDGATN